MGVAFREEDERIMPAAERREKARESELHSADSETSRPRDRGPRRERRTCTIRATMLYASNHDAPRMAC